MPSDVLITPATSKIDFTDGANSTKKLSISGTAFSFDSNLNVLSSTSLSSAFKAQGVNGTLFEVIDDLSNSLMSVNTIGGLPVFEVFANNSIIAGQYNANDFVILGNKIGLGYANPVNKLSVSGSVSIGSSYNVAAPSNGLIVQGNVGIGTVSPSARLTIVDNTNGGIINLVGRTSDDTAAVNFRVTSDASTYAYISPDTNEFRLYHNDGFMSFYPGGTEKWRITAAGILESNGLQTIRTNTGNLTLATALGNGHILLSPHGTGNVGIGRASPQQKLHIAGTNARLAISNDSDNNWAEIGNDGSSGQNTLEFFTGSSVTSAMSITNANKVGIGTIAPVAKLHIGSDVEPNISNQTLFVQGSKTGYAGFAGLPMGGLMIYDDTASTAGSGGAISFGANTGSSQRTWIAAIESRRDSAVNDGTNYGGSLVFYTRPAQATPEERMRITSAGSFRTDLDASYHMGILNEYVSTYVSRTKFGRWNNTSNLELYYYIAGTEEPRITRNLSTAVLKFNRGSTTDMIIGSTGNVGIGVISPDSKLHIISDVAAGTNNYALRLQNTTTVSDARVGIAFLDNSNITSNGSGATIQVSNNGVDGGGNLLFGSLLNGANTERMRIKSDGNVGIGTTTPAQKLELYDVVGDPYTSGVNSIAMMRFSNTTDNAILNIGMRAAGAGAWLQSTDKTNLGVNYPLLLNPNGGNVSVGSLTSNNKLHVNGSASIGSGYNTAATTNGLIVEGNVGIGVTGPTAKLDVAGSATSGYSLLLRSGDAYNQTDSVQIAFGHANTTNYRHSIRTRHNPLAPISGIVGNNIDFYVWKRGTDAGVDLGTQFVMTMQGDGNVGIGITNPADKLHVVGNAEVGDSTADTGLIIRSGAGSSQYGRIRFYSTSTNTSTIHSFPAAWQGGTFLNSSAGALNLGSTNGITFGSWNNVDVAFAQGGNIYFKGNVGIGITAPSAALHVNSTTSGATLLRADGTNGTLFSVVDDLSDSLMSVNNSAGLPVLEVFADDRVVAGQYGANDFVLINNKLGLGTSSPANKLTVIGAASIGSSTYNVAAPSNGLIVQGNVGIGVTTNPESKLQVNGEVRIASSSSYFTHLNYLDGGSNLISSSNGGSTLFRGSANNLTSMVVYGSGTVSTNYNTYLAATSGNVGIGTITPGSKLHLSGTGVTELRITSTTANTNSLLSFYESSLASWGIDAGQANGSFFIKDLFNTRTVLTLNASGNVGIGTTSPTQRLDVVGSYGAADDNSGILKIRGAATGAYTQLNFGISASAGYGWIQATQLSVSNELNIILGPLGGNVGIGTTSPATNLEIYKSVSVAGESYQDILTVTAVDDNGGYFYTGLGAGIAFRSGKTSANVYGPSIMGSIYGANSGDESIANGYLSFHTRNSNTVAERMRVTNTGNVGIGKTTPNAKLNVLSTSSLSSVFKTEGVNGTLFEVTDDLSNSLMSVNTIGGLPVFEVFANNSIIAGQYGQNDFVISGNKVGIGTSSPSYKLHVNGSLGVNAGTSDGNWPFIVVDSISSGGSNRYALNKIGAMGFNYADSYAQLQLIGANGAYIDFGNAAIDDSDARIIYHSNNRFDISYGTTITLNSTGAGVGVLGPSAKLHVQTTAGSVTTPNVVAIFQANTDTTIIAGGGTAIKFRGVSSGGNLQDYDQCMISSLGYAGNNQHGMQFWVKPNAGTVLTAALTINNDSSVVANSSVTAASFSGLGTNLTGTASSLTAGTATNVAWSGITSKPTTLAGYALTDVAYGQAAYQSKSLDTVSTPGLYQYDGAFGGTKPPDNGANYRTVEIGSGSRFSQIAMPWNSENIYFRRITDSTYSAWRTVIHDGNYTSYPDATKLPLTGGTLTGAITVNGVSDAVVVQTNGNAAQWYGRISVRNSTSDKSSFLGTYQGIAGVFAHNNALSAWADLYVNTVDGTNGGIVRMSADVRIGGNAALHAATTSAPSLSIGGSSATCTGAAAAVPWSGITSKPTTLSGFGITDAMYQSNPNGFTQGDINGSGNMQRLWGTDSVQNLLAFRPPTTVEYTTDNVNWVATSISNNVFDNKVFGKWSGFNMNAGTNVGGWTKVRMTWVNFGYHFFSHFTLCHSTNGHSMNFVFYKSDLNGVFSSESYRVNGISSWPGYTFTAHNNVSGWWDTRDVRMVFELNGNNGPSGYPNNAISIGHIGIMGGYSSFNRLFEWDGNRNIDMYGNLSVAAGTVTALNFSGPGTSLTGTASSLVAGSANAIADGVVSTSAKISNSVVTLAKIENISTGTILGNNGVSAGAPIALTSAQIAAMLSGQTMNINGSSTTCSGLAASATTAAACTGNAAGLSATLAVASGGTGGNTQALGRTGLGATTVGANLFTLANPSAISFIRINAANTVEALNAADFRNAISAGTGNGTVTSVTGTAPIASSGGATPAISLNDAGVTTANIANSNVTLAKLANISTGHILGNNTGADAAPLALTSAQVVTMLGIGTSSSGTVTNIATGDGLSGGPITATGTITVDTTVVRTTGTQTIGGAKTFSSTIAGSINGNAGSVTDGVYLSTNQSIGGVKTFSSAPVATNIAKAWVYYNMNNNTTYASYNVSSVADNGTGVCTVNFSTAMVDANYVVAGTATYGYDDQDIYAMILAVPRRSTAQQAGSCRLATEFIHAAQVYDCVAVRAVFYR